MKKTLLLIINLFFFSQITFAQDFITTWQLINGSTAISFGVVTQGTVSYTWETVLPSAPASGSGIFTGPTANITGLPFNATIKIAIQPQNLRRFTSVESYFAYNLIDVNQWGNVPWISMENAFKFCRSLQVSATDIPNLAGVTSLANMFESCISLNSPFNLNAWNISTVTNLSGMFRFCYSFNQALSLWNTANVTDMSGMFEESGFNQNIGNWNTSNVTNMSKMFNSASIFNRNIGNWNTANVTDMSEMFGSAAIFDLPMIFNQNIGNWNTSSVVNMSGMFRNAKFFNQNIGNWNTANVTNMSEMFQRANAFNQNIGNWNTGNVINMARMFSNDNFNSENESYAFNNGGNSSIENWNTANVTNMSGMFFKANLFNHNLGNWALNPAVILTTMLDECGLDCEKYSQTLIGWSTNPNTPTNKILGATFLQFGPEAQSAVNNLIFNKNWGFSGHDIITTVPEFDFQTVFCQGVTITPLPTTSIDGISGTWSPALNNQETTTYTFTPNVGQCALPVGETLFINSNTIPAFSDILPICSGANLPALPNTSTNGVTGTWSPALNNTATTTYTFTPNANQCATIQTLTITVNPSITPTFDIIAPICSGEILAPLPNTSTNGITGTWSPAFNNTTTTTYTFTPNSELCTANQTLTIVVNPNITPSFAEIPPICSGEFLADLPTTSTNGISGSWSPALNNLTTTTYTFTPNTGQCATTQTLTITVNPIVTPNFAIVAPICSGGTLTALPATSTNGIAGTWSPALNNLTTTTYTFTPNANQCATIQTLTITVNPSTTPTFDVIAPICSGEILAPLPTSSTNGIAGTWSPSLNNTATTTYTFTPNSELCTANQTLTIVVNPNITPNFVEIPPICSGEILADLPTTSTNGISGSWSPSLNNLTTTTYTFTPNTGQCATTKTLTITVNSIVTPTFTEIAPICTGANLALPTTSTNGISGTWSPALNNTATTTYTFTPNANQCATSATITIVVSPELAPTFNQVTSICIGEILAPLPTTSTNGISGTWSPNLNNLTTTTYTFTPNSGQCTVTMTIVVNENLIPNFTAVQSVCIGDYLAPLPTTSLNGNSGTWSPALNNQETTVYTFTPNIGQCATTQTLTIIVSPIVTPNFATIAPICSGENLEALPTTSTNGITGTWSPALNDQETTVYTFTPNGPQCATTSSLTIQVNQIALPNGISNQIFPENSTIANIVINPSNAIWYANLSDALANNDPLTSSTLLIDNATYFAVNDDGQCRSQPFAVTIDVTLGISTLNKEFLKIYPNPVTSVLQISYNNTINSVEIYSVLGQLLISKRMNAFTYTIDMSTLASALYLVKINAENQTGEFKILKK